MDITTAEALGEILQENWEAEAVQAASATVADYTVEVSHHARPHHWPQVDGALITLTHDGQSRTHRVSEDGPHSWDDFEALLVEMDYAIQAEFAVASLHDLGREYRDLQAKYERARERVQGAARSAYHLSQRAGEPVTRYRIAQEVGVRQATVERWLG